MIIVTGHFGTGKGGKPLVNSKGETRTGIRLASEDANVPGLFTDLGAAFVAPELAETLPIGSVCRCVKRTYVDKAGATQVALELLPA